MFEWRAFIGSVLISVWEWGVFTSLESLAVMVNFMST